MKVINFFIVLLSTIAPPLLAMNDAYCGKVGFSEQIDRMTQAAIEAGNLKPKKDIRNDLENRYRKFFDFNKFGQFAKDFFNLTAEEYGALHMLSVPSKILGRHLVGDFYLEPFFIDPVSRKVFVLNLRETLSRVEAKILEAEKKVTDARITRYVNTFKESLQEFLTKFNNRYDKDGNINPDSVISSGDTVRIKRSLGRGIYHFWYRLWLKINHHLGF